MKNLVILLWRIITFPFVYVFQSLFGTGQDAVDVPNRNKHTIQDEQGNEGLTVTQPKASYVSSDGMASLYFKVGLTFTALVSVAVYSSRSLGWMSENISIDGNGERPAPYSSLSYSTPLTSANEYFVASKQQMMSMDSSLIQWSKALIVVPSFNGSLIQWSKALVVGRKHNSLQKVTNAKKDVRPVSSQVFQAGNNDLLPTMMLSSSVLKDATSGESYKVVF